MTPTLLRACCSVLLLFLLATGFTQAAPQIDWVEQLENTRSAQNRSSLSIDLRGRWERTLVGRVSVAEDVPLDPTDIWAWPRERFSSKPEFAPYTLRSGERMITRWTVFNEKLDTDFLVSIAMPRLDAVHISYRYDYGPWMTLSAGDRIAMNAWPLADRQPSFNLPTPIGQMDVVMQFAHRGVVDAPTFLQNHRAFIEMRTNAVLPIGVTVGINLVLALLGLMMAQNFRKFSFLSVSIVSLMVALVLLFGSGLGGMLMGGQVNDFNDQAKYWIQSSWGVLLPLVAALALSIQLHSRVWWRATILITCLGVGLLAFAAEYSKRYELFAFLSLALAGFCIFLLLMLGWAWLKNYTRNYSIAGGVVLYVVAVAVLFVAHTGQYSVLYASMWSALLSMLASLGVLRGLFIQHRMGRQLQARANISPLRDVLTGLLNREGMQAHVYKAREQMRSEQICALFVYIPVQDAKVAMEEVGEQGFEAGMVQIAASLSSHISGTDGVGRISHHAFGICTMMQPDPAIATRLAQKILSRVMMLATQSTPLCCTVRVALAWLPVNSFRIDSLESRCLEALETLESGKRIAWVGGPQSHKAAAEMQRSMNTTPSDPAADTIVDASTTLRQDSSTLYERIHRIEREMLGLDTQFLQEEAERLSRQLNEASDAHQKTDALGLAPNASTDDFAPTQQAFADRKI